MSKFAVHFINTGSRCDTSHDPSRFNRLLFRAFDEAIETALTLLLLRTGLKAGVNDTSDHAELHLAGFAVSIESRRPPPLNAVLPIGKRKALFGDLAHRN